MQGNYYTLLETNMQIKKNIKKSRLKTAFGVKNGVATILANNKIIL